MDGGLMYKAPREKGKSSKCNIDQIWQRQQGLFTDIYDQVTLRASPTKISKLRCPYFHHHCYNNLRQQGATPSYFGRY
jgi:hypothetical protein